MKRGRSAPQRSAGAAVAVRDDLGQHRERDLAGGLPAEVEARGGVQPVKGRGVVSRLELCVRGRGTTTASEYRQVPAGSGENQVHDGGSPGHVVVTKDHGVVVGEL